jgi:protein HOOK3
LEAEVDASQTLVREVCSEREELRKMLDTKQNEISAEDQEVMNEMQMLLGEFEIVNSEGGDLPQKSSFELLKQCAGVLEKNVERLAQRAEVIPKYLWICDSLLFQRTTALTCFTHAVHPTAERAYQVAPGEHEEL